MKQEQSRDERLQRLWMINKRKYKGKIISSDMKDAQGLERIGGLLVRRNNKSSSKSAERTQ